MNHQSQILILSKMMRMEKIQNQFLSHKTLTKFHRLELLDSNNRL